MIKDNDVSSGEDDERKLDPRKTFSTNKAIKDKKRSKRYLVKKEIENL